MRAIAFIILCGGLLSSCDYINPRLGLSNDWWGEELTETGIKMKTGVDVDLSPQSPEKK